MNAEERDLITSFVQRVGGAPAASGFAGSVPTTLPVAPQAPVDREADALLADLFTRYPEARYRVTQLAFVQEHALAEAQNIVNRLQYDLQQARSQLQAQQAPPPAAPSPWGAAAQQPQPAAPRGIFGGLFGGGQQAAPPPQYAPQPQYAPPPPQYAPGYQPGMFQRPGGGSGFLGSALTTAAGVAGGMLATNAIMGMFGGHSGFGGGMGGGFGGGMGGGTTIVNNYGDAQQGGGFAAAPDAYDQGGSQKDFGDQSGGDQSGGGWSGGDSSGGDSSGGSDWSSSSDPSC